MADVSLGVLLQRLQQLGLEKYFWGNGEKPYLAKYFTRIVKRESFKSWQPSTTALIKSAWSKLPFNYKIWAVGIPTALVGILIFKPKHL